MLPFANTISIAGNRHRPYSIKIRRHAMIANGSIMGNCTANKNEQSIDCM